MNEETQSRSWIRRKRIKPEKTRRPIKSSKGINVLTQNAIKFTEFVEDKSHKIIEKKQDIVFSISPFHHWLSIFDVVLGSKQLLENSRVFQSEIKIGEEYVFDDGVYQEFYRHFQKNLSRTSDINLANELNSFLRLYFIKPTPQKRGRKEKETTRQFIELAERGLNASQITNIFADKEFQRLQQFYLSQGFPKDSAKNMAKIDLKVWKLEEGKRIREALRYHGISRRSSKTAEKLIPKFSAQKKQN